MVNFNSHPYFLNDYSLSPSQKWLFPIHSPYGDRHLAEVSNNLLTFTQRVYHAVLGSIEVFPVVGALVSLIERIIFAVSQKLSSHTDASNSSSNPNAISEGQNLVAASLDYKTFSPIFIYQENTGVKLDLNQSPFKDAPTLTSKSYIPDQDFDPINEKILKLKDENPHRVVFQIFRCSDRLNADALNCKTYNEWENTLGLPVQVIVICNSDAGILEKSRDPNRRDLIRAEFKALGSKKRLTDEKALFERINSILQQASVGQSP